MMQVMIGDFFERRQTILGESYLYLKTENEVKVAVMILRILN